MSTIELNIVAKREKPIEWEYISTLEALQQAFDEGWWIQERWEGPNKHEYWDSLDPVSYEAGEWKAAKDFIENGTNINRWRRHVKEKRLIVRGYVEKDFGIYGKPCISLKRFQNYKAMLKHETNSKFVKWIGDIIYINYNSELIHDCL